MLPQAHVQRAFTGRRTMIGAWLAVCVLAAATAARVTSAQETGPLFKTGVDLVNVTATVSDDDGRFVSGLGKQDFQVFENGKPQEVTLFSNERVSVSLGILLDASGSMNPEKMAAARQAIERFASDLLGPEDEMFFMEFSNTARLTQSWTTDRKAISDAVGRVAPVGGTAMYDAIAEALPLAAGGRHRKKAILVISDGNDTNSRLSVVALRRAIRETEVLVYALGVDSQQGTSFNRPRTQPRWPGPFPVPGVGRPQLRLPFPPRPFPTPGGRRPPTGQPPGVPPIGGGTTWQRNSAERVNADALREITDESGGRTEIVRDFGDLRSATERLADELSKQYYLGFSSTEPKDGRWHSIRVDVRDRRMKVRARRGYVAS